MDVREKLVELCEDLETLPCCDTYEGQAEYLIAHGVTVQENVEISDELLKQLKNAPITICKEEPSIELVQEWISVDDRLPEPKHEFDARNWYLVALSNGVVKELAYEFHNHSVFGYGWRETAYPVTHWMPLPEPPKGE